MINGTMLKSPAALYSNKKLSDSIERMGKPEIREMDTMYQSFRPGLKQSKRYEMQD